jgi:uncharacterized protein GlcG (DUF336 family)
MRHLAFFLCALPLAAQPVLHTELRDGVSRAIVLRAETMEPVTEENPAVPGERLVVSAEGMSGDVAVLIGAMLLPASMRDDGMIEFDVPVEAVGSFVEISIESDGARSNAATFPARDAETAAQLTAADVRTLMNAAAMAIDDPRLVVAVVDRAGRPLGVYARPSATVDDTETALSLARTGAFFSHNEAPLSSRTVRSISTVNFPEGIPNQPAAALYGIENTNRGCDLNTTFEPGKMLPRSTSLAGGFSKGITTRAGGLPVYRGDDMIGGIGVGGVPPDVAEFAALSAVLGGFFKATIPPPKAVFIDGFRLPFVNQTTQPEGTRPAAAPGGTDIVAPRAGAAAPDEWIIGPRSSADLTAAEVQGIIEKAAARARRTRAVIRLPLGTRAKFVYSVTDLQGNILGLYRDPDSTIFSLDVALTKARNVVYFSSANTDPLDRLPGVPPGTAYTNRTIGFTSQIFFPSGIFNSDPGPFYQLYDFDVRNPCTQGRQPRNPNQSGIVFFPGSAPLYKGGRLVGGFGVSGDGVEQDDYVTAGGVEGFEPPESIRADQFMVDSRLGRVRLPYWKFPRNPEQ